MLQHARYHLAGSPASQPHSTPWLVPLWHTIQRVARHCSTIVVLRPHDHVPPRSAPVHLSDAGLALHLWTQSTSAVPPADSHAHSLENQTRRPAPHQKVLARLLQPTPGNTRHGSVVLLSPLRFPSGDPAQIHELSRV